MKNDLNSPVRRTVFYAACPILLTFYLALRWHPKDTYKQQTTLSYVLINASKYLKCIIIISV